MEDVSHLLDATAYLTWGVAGECENVKGAERADCVLGAGQAMAFLASLEGDRASRLAPGAQVFSAPGQPVLVHGARPARGAHTFSLCSSNVTVWQVVSRHIQRRIVPPEPCRDPAPRRVDHLHHHTPVTLNKSPQPPTNTRSPTLNPEEPDKYSDVWRSYVTDEMTPAEFRDWYNTAGNYRVEFSSRNRARIDE